jgi:hypothetical protein
MLGRRLRARGLSFRETAKGPQLLEPVLPIARSHAKTSLATTPMTAHLGEEGDHAWKQEASLLVSLDFGTHSDLSMSSALATREDRLLGVPKASDIVLEELSVFAVAPTSRVRASILPQKRETVVWGLDILGEEDHLHQDARADLFYLDDAKPAKAQELAISEHESRDEHEREIEREVLVCQPKTRPRWGIRTALPGSPVPIPDGETTSEFNVDTSWLASALFHPAQDVVKQNNRHPGESEKKQRSRVATAETLVLEPKREGRMERFHHVRVSPLDASPTLHRGQLVETQGILTMAKHDFDTRKVRIRELPVRKLAFEKRQSVALASATTMLLRATFSHQRRSRTHLETVITLLTPFTSTTLRAYFSSTSGQLEMSMGKVRLKKEVDEHVTVFPVFTQERRSFAASEWAEVVPVTDPEETTVNIPVGIMTVLSNHDSWFQVTCIFD